jgi:hypothetical protein
MPPDDENDEKPTGESLPSATSSGSFQRQANRVRNLFSIPAPVKRLFDKVPVLTYPPNELPQRTPRPNKLPSLYVFIGDEDAAAGRPSFNPGCLKWQVRDAGNFFIRGLLTFHRRSSESPEFNTVSSPQTIMPLPPESFLSYCLHFMAHRPHKNHRSPFLQIS